MAGKYFRDIRYGMDDPRYGVQRCAFELLAFPPQYGTTIFPSLYFWYELRPALWVPITMHFWYLLLVRNDIASS